MATYAIGDIQGCFTTLSRLLDRIAFDPAGDRIWLVGDLVNRGPDSLAVLRWAKSLGPSLVTVLGNHDLHLLARAEGLREARRRDTLDDVLEAEEREELIDWLAARPVLYREDDYALVHGGIAPGTSLDEATVLAREAEALLGSPRRRELLASLYKDSLPALGSPPLEGLDRIARGVDVLTHVRTVKPNGALCLDYTGPPESAPPGCRPWFELVSPGRTTIVFGHWARLGLYVADRFLGLDTGCVWGGPLTAVRLEDRKVYQEPSELA